MARKNSTAGTVVAEVDSGSAELVPDRDRPGAWALLVDGAPQSHVDLADPTRLVFGYQRRLGHVVDAAAPAGRPLSVLHLGGGALTLPRYVAATRPRSRQQVAEIDTRLTELVRRELPLDRNWQIRVRGGDAREVLAKTPEGWADLLIADVFRGARVPAHCTTVEFTALAARALTPGGLYAANIADGGRLDFARGQLATLRSAFSDVAVLADPAVLRGRRFGNLVVLASAGPLPLAALRRATAADATAPRLLEGSEARDFEAGARPVTDAAAVDSPLPPDGTF